MLSAGFIARRLAPGAHPNYLAALDHSGTLLDRYEITTPLRLAHFLAQVLHESAGLTALRESGTYSAARIQQIFGVGKHSAAVTATEATRLAGDGPALFERVYGRGNPKKAAELGNTERGDAWRYRGGGLMQITGGNLYRLYGFAAYPETITSADRCLEPALKIWKAKGCNALADRNDIREITKRINGGYNGYADRVDWFNKLWPMVRPSDGPAESWKVAEASEETRLLQQQLDTLGYDLKIDGRVGPKTTAAIVAFQKANGLRADGIAGDITLATIKARLASPAPTIGSAVVADPPGIAAPAAQGLGTVTVAEVGQKIVDQASVLEPYTNLTAVIGWACAGLTAIGVAIIAVGLIRAYAIPAIWPAKVPVPE